MTYKCFHADLGYLDPQSLNVTSALPSVKNHYTILTYM